MNTFLKTSNEHAEQARDIDYEEAVICVECGEEVIGENLIAYRGNDYHDDPCFQNNNEMEDDLCAQMAKALNPNSEGDLAA